MSDHYYYRSLLYNTMQSSAKFSCTRKVKHFDEITNWNEEVINEAKHIFREDDIEKMFDTFRENNFRENPVCEYVLGE